MKKNRNIIIYCLITIFTFVLGFGVINAQEDGFEVNLTLGTQSITNKRVPLIIKFKPTISSENTEITFDHSYGIEVDPNFNNYFTTNADEVYTLKAYVIPEQSGSYDITVTIVSWGLDSNITSTENIPISFNNALVVTPVQAGYTLNITIIAIVALLLGIAFTILLVKGLKILIERFKKWMKPPVY